MTGNVNTQQLPADRLPADRLPADRLPAAGQASPLLSTL